MKRSLSLLLFATPLFAQQPATPDALFQSGIAGLKAEHYSEAETAFRQVYELEPDNLRGLVGLAHVYIAQNQLDKAVDLVQKESAKDPARADFHIVLGDLAAQAKRNDEALAEYRKSLSLMDIKSAGDLQVPRGIGTQIIPKGAAGVYARIAETNLITGDPKSAVTALQKANALSPQNTLIQTNLGIALETSGDKTAALAEYREALASNPRNPIALNNLAFLIAETGGDLYEALRFARLARQGAPQSDDVSDTIAWVTLKLGWTDDALQAFRDLVKKDPGNQAVRLHLLAALDQKHETSADNTALTAALKAKPTPENQETIVELLNRAQRPK